ncbi:MAG: 4-hydroxythreonine-4-phosphate dehydrogenase PdxA [Alphaproteobacteria bacterium]|nr:4-hydroxythreonine-4-phosphate dehydrogenase PdxA [Alphaproteobacteria bacterium]
MSCLAQEKPLVLTCGEPAGIGPEITASAWSRSKGETLPPFFLIADPAILHGRTGDVPVHEITSPEECLRTFGSALPVLPIEADGAVVPGKPSISTASMVISSIEKAVGFTTDGRAAAVVTNPIQKAILTEAGFKHPGHTEFLAHLAAPHGTPPRPVMMLANETLRAVPVTIHIPLAQVPSAVTGDLIIETCHVVHNDLQKRFHISQPRLAVSGLNPHAGEDGHLGTEDRDVIAPAVRHLAAQGMDVTGPYPADAMFRDTARDGFDVAICMYHDQALLPVKTLGFHTSVNVTLGLPFVRTSPDHGTALDLAGTDGARPDSLIAAIRMAAEMSVQAADA